MTSSKNTNAKAAVNADTTEETEASVPQQSAGEKVTVLKGRGGESEADGKDAVVISDEEPKDGVVDKFKKLIRDKRVLAGLGTVAAIAIVAVAKSMLAGSVEEDDVTITTEKDEAGNITSVTITNNDVADADDTE